MPAPKVRADHDDLARIASSFGRQSQNSQRALQRIRRELDTLQGGDWIGKGAQAFYKEMDQDVLPALKRLAEALAQAQRTTVQISQILKQAEQEAARLLRAIVGGDGRDGAAPLAASRGWADALQDLATGLNISSWSLTGLGRLASNVAANASLVLQQRWQQMASIFARGGEEALDRSGIHAIVASWTSRSARAAQMAEVLDRWSDRLGKATAGVTAVSQGARSSAETWLGRLTSGGAAGAFSWGTRKNPLVFGADMAGMALGVDGPSSIMNASFESIVVTSEGLITGSPVGMSNLHQRQLSGEWGPLFREAAEAGDFWAEHGVVGGLGMFWDAVTDSF